MGFKRMSKMDTTEPSVDEAGKGMKKGGRAKMMDGGVPPAAAMGGRQASAMPPLARRAAPPAVGLPRRPSAPGMLMRKKGGKAEGGETHAEHMAEMKRMGRIEKELKSHEEKPASKGHKGLKTGGVANAQGGYKKGGKIRMQVGGTPARAAELAKLAPGALTPATRDMAEKVRTESTVYPSALKSLGPQPTDREMQMLRESQAEAKRAAQEEAAYNAATRRKTGGVVKKFATGGVVKGGVAGYKAGGACMSEGGFTVMKKSKSW